MYIWEFPKIRVPYFGGPYNKDPTIWGTILGSPIFGNSHIEGCGDPLTPHYLESRTPVPGTVFV